MVTNPKPSQRRPADWSPNQVAKRDMIIQAACHIMATEGVRACTARSVSAESGLSTSSIHYYFRDTDEILDLAFRRITDRFFAHIEASAAAAADPVEALWNTVYAYVERGGKSPVTRRTKVSRRAPMLWFEFQAESLRSGNLVTVRELSSRGSTIFAKLVAAVGAANPEGKAEALYCAIVGAVVRDLLFHRPTEEYVAELMRALDLPIPERFQAEPVRVKRVARKK
jgi:AcrR family transcriptional regulator